MVVEGAKISSQVAPTIRFALGKAAAQWLYTKAIDWVRGSNKGGLGWSEEAFDVVDWGALAQALKNKPKGLQVRLSKQAIGGLCSTKEHSKNSGHN